MKSSLKGIAPYVAIYAVHVVLLHAIDGPWRRWKRYGAFDAWTATHVAWGAIGRVMGVPEGTMVALTVANELVELGARRLAPQLTWGAPETPPNVVADVVTTWGGWKAADELMQPRPDPWPSLRPA